MYVWLLCSFLCYIVDVLFLVCYMLNVLYVVLFLMLPFLFCNDQCLGVDHHLDQRFWGQDLTYSRKRTVEDAVFCLRYASFN